ncbi:hypothetical protein KTE19_08685 [Lentilactobacillus sp. IMAU92037]|uniref:hypothetical protein n=1 Tax=Lentilactobacillus TaxID=2767893 RepID=UPI001C2BC185|nr:MULTISPECIES: hypothetical protein [Lentilactobacillus]MBV0930769.1 hypothetical protein [Lentilactobacillus dabitei]MDM7517007.1 hypothetical protein [Lentilactobacillus sp. TOM.63]
MIKKLYALSKFETNIVLSDKAIFLFTLLFPTVYFLFNAFTANSVHSVRNFYDVIPGFWTYMVLVGVINQITSAIVTMRENNFLKMFTFIAGDKRLIYYANLIPQIFIIQAEILIFDVVAALVYRVDPAVIEFMALTWLANFLIIPIVSFFTSLILLAPVKVQTMGALMTGYIFLGLALAYISTGSFALNTVLAAINPGNFIIRAYILMIPGVSHHVSYLVMLAVVAVVYTIVSNVVISRMSLNSSTSRA